MLRHYLTDTGHPARLFKGGEPGFCLPSVAEALRFGALWQDSAGSTAAAIGATVGRMGFPIGLANVASQTTPTKRPLLTHRVNLHTQTEDFSNAAWTKSGATIDATKYADINGELRAQKVTFANGDANAILTQTLPIQLGNILRRFWIRADSATTVRNQSRNNGSSSAAPVINVTTSWQLVERSVTASGTGVDIVGWQNNAAGDAAPIYLCEVDTRPVGLNPLLPKPPRVVTDADCDTGGFPPFLRFDGIDDCLVTPAIDFSACEAVTVIAGIIKAETMVAGALLEHGNAASVNGAFSVYAPLAGAYSGRHIRIGQRGPSADGGFYYNIESNNYVFAQQFVAAGVDRANRYPAWAINGNTLYPRLATGPDDPLLATSFLNDVLYVGQRTASINPFNGDLYSLTVIGRRLSNAEMLNTSRWINEQMGRVY